MRPSRPVQHGPASTQPRIALLGGFALHLGDRPVTLPLHASRVLAYLCLDRLSRPACARHHLAGRLWAEASTERAYASLRTALWRIRQTGLRIVLVDHDWLRLGAVDVDVHQGCAQAIRLLSDDPRLYPIDMQVTALVGDLLPGWGEDWLLLERERLRQLQIHALEALAARLRRMGKFPQAIDVAYAVIDAEPLRESGHVALIDAHLAEGNVAQAHQQLRRYSELLHAELGMSPSPAMLARVNLPPPVPVGPPASG
jgi:DNA-binding SARP family transcriptional activator